MESGTLAKVIGRWIPAGTCLSSASSVLKEQGTVRTMIKPNWPPVQLIQKNLICLDRGNAGLVVPTSELEQLRKGLQERSTPSMRRPVDVKAHVHFLLFVSLFPFSQLLSVAK